MLLAYAVAVQMRQRGVTPGYQLAGRANLFGAYAHLARSRDGAQRLLRWNKFQTECAAPLEPPWRYTPAAPGICCSRTPGASLGTQPGRARLA